MSKRLKILMQCYSCSPYSGSERGMGWNFALHVSRFHDVHLIVEEKDGRPVMEKYAQEHPEAFEHITLHYIRKVQHPILRKIWPPIYYHFYNKWEKKAYRLAKALDAEEHFDLVHRVTLSSYRSPGYLWKLGKPFIWGPVCGFTNTAWCLLPGLGLHGIVYFTCRNIINRLQFRWGRQAHAAAAHASAIMVSDAHALPEIKRYWGKDALLMSDGGIPEDGYHPVMSPHEPGTPLRICWSGVLTTLKALNFVLAALPLCRQKVELHILGKGEKEQEWKALAEHLGVADKVFFHGFLPHHQAQAFLESCHVFCHSSIKEGGLATVVLEALRAGLPLVVIDHCAHASVVTEACGIKIPVMRPQQLSERFAAAFDKLAEDEALRHRMAESALERARHYTWPKRMETVLALYENAVSGQREIGR